MSYNLDFEVSRFLEEGRSKDVFVCLIEYIVLWPM